MGNKDKSLKRCYKKKRKFYDNRHTKKSNTTTITSTPIINQVNPTTSSSTDLPGTSLSSKKLKLISNNSASNNNESSVDSIDRNDGGNCIEAVCDNSDVKIRLDLLGKFPALKNCRGGHSFFLLLSQTPLYISFNWSILALVIIIYSTCREYRGFRAALFVKTQINVKCKVFYKVKENFVENFWLTGKTDFSVFWYRHASKHRESDSVEVFVVQSTQIDQNEFF